MKTIEELETELRAIWKRNGVPQAKQDALLADIEAKARPEYMASIFPPREAPHV